MTLTEYSVESVIGGNTVSLSTGKLARQANGSVILKCGNTVLLTTATTIFGLLPLALGISIDVLGREIVVGSRVVGWGQNLASSIVFGLAFSTILTLIFTPAALTLPSRIRLWFENRYDFLKPTSEVVNKKS